METDDVDRTGAVGTSTDDVEPTSAVNTLILDYYKKFGRKRDLEQFFSLSTAQSDIRDTGGLFWRKMKSENDSSDSGGRRSDSSAQELCRISIRCSMPEPSTSQSDDPKTKTESPQTESPPIITEEVPANISRQTDDESFKSDDNQSQKSFDPLLDLSSHKPLSPTSSITSQRKLEWDSLADVGYANESDRKTSGSSLSTLERLALKQQYSSNDSKHEIGPPTSHSTPLDENEARSKTKKGGGRKMTKIVKKDVDFVEVNLPRTSDSNPPKSINVNLTKHISFNVEKDGAITVDNIRKDVNVSPEKIGTDASPYQSVDKENQTSLPKTKQSNCSLEEQKPVDINAQKIPVMISLNTLRKRLRRKKSKFIRKRLRSRTKSVESKDIPVREKSGEQLSEAESFEYMPGHIYNQNQMIANEANEPRHDHNSTAGNKSSLESSAGLTTDSSKGSKHSLTKDLEKCINVLKVTLQKRYDDDDVKKTFIKDIVKRLLNSKYRDDDTSTDFLSGLSFNSKNLDLRGNNTTTSTSDGNNTNDSKHRKPRKSILRTEKFDANLASTSQSAPNLFMPTGTEKPNTNLNTIILNTESDASSREKTSSDNAILKKSSEELYLQYLEALRREESYKRHLREKEKFLKQKLINSDTTIKAPVRQEATVNNRLKELLKDLTRNNYDDGSGDASKLEGGSLPDRNMDRYSDAGGRTQRSHSVFTLSSHESQKKQNLKKKMQVDRDLDACTSKNHYCCCPHHSVNSKNIGYADSSVQVNIKCQYEDSTNEKTKQPNVCICSNNNKSPDRSPRNKNDNILCEERNQCSECKEKQKRQRSNSPKCQKCGKFSKYAGDESHAISQRSPRNITKMVSDKDTGDIKYVCVGKEKPASSTNTGEFMIYKCSKLTQRGIQFEDLPDELACKCGKSKSTDDDGIMLIRPPCNSDNVTVSTCSDNSNLRKYSQCSQTKMFFDLMSKKVMKDCNEPESINLCGTTTRSIGGLETGKKTVIIHEATRCCQTEISFNPKISDPRLCDINIINDCAELICEQNREIVLNNSANPGGKKSFSDVCTSSDSTRFLLRPSDTIFAEDFKDSDMRFTDTKDSIATSSGKPNDYKIPIEGTNMTLMVTLASKCNKETKEKVSLGVGTNKPTIGEQGTCITTECTKLVQCDCAALTKTAPSLGDHGCVKSSISSRASPRKPCLTKLSPAKSPTRNTYPKTVQVKEKKPLRRANTDSGKLETCACCVQTDKTCPVLCSPKKYPKCPLICDNSCQVGDSNNSTCSKTSRPHSAKKEVGIQNDLCDDNTSKNKHTPEMKCVGCSTETAKKGSTIGCQTDAKEADVENACISEDAAKGEFPCDEVKETCSKKDCVYGKCQCVNNVCGNDKLNDPILGMIHDITRRYSKTDIMKMKKKKCFSEIVTVIKYLLETDDSSDQDSKRAGCAPNQSSDNSGVKTCYSQPCSPPTSLNKDKGSKGSCLKRPTSPKSTSNEKPSRPNSPACYDKCLKPKKESDCGNAKKPPRQSECKRDKGIQPGSKSNSKCTESSELPCSTDLPSTSDSTACKIFNKIKKECEKYHLRRFKCGRKCEISSSTSVNCDFCKRVHHCGCRHKCKRTKTVDRLSRKCVAYNLILQTSESMLSEETSCFQGRPLQNVVVKVPKRKETCKETIYKIEKGLRTNCSPRASRSRSCPKESELSSADDCARKTQQCTVREYLEKNRPDFVEKSCERQNCLKFVKEVRANERAAQRDLLSLHVDRQPDLTTLSTEQLRRLAQQIGLDIRRKKPAPKFISEHEMKKHSEKIYKTLPEVVQKKEDKKKERIKKTNLLMANMFKKNLQKKTLSGAVNISNYSTVIKI